MISRSDLSPFESGWETTVKTISSPEDNIPICSENSLFPGTSAPSMWVMISYGSRPASSAPSSAMIPVAYTPGLLATSPEAAAESTISAT